MAPVPGPSGNSISIRCAPGCIRKRTATGAGFFVYRGKLWGWMNLWPASVSNCCAAAVRTTNIFGWSARSRAERICQEPRTVGQLAGDCRFRRLRCGTKETRNGAAREGFTEGQSGLLQPVAPSSYERNWRLSQAFTNRKSRKTEYGETLRILAVSSSVKPPK